MALFTRKRRQARARGYIADGTPSGRRFVFEPPDDGWPPRTVDLPDPPGSATAGRMRRFRAVRPQHGYVYLYVFEETADAPAGAEEPVVVPKATVEPVVAVEPVADEDPARGGPVGSVDEETGSDGPQPPDVDVPDGPEPRRRGDRPSSEEVGRPRSQPANERERLAALVRMLDDQARVDERSRAAERLAAAKRAKRAAARRATAERLAAKRAAVPQAKAAPAVARNAAAHRAAIVRAAAQRAQVERAAIVRAAAQRARAERAVAEIAAKRAAAMPRAAQEQAVQAQARQAAVQQAARAAAVYR